MSGSASFCVMAKMTACAQGKITINKCVLACQTSCTTGCTTGCTNYCASHCIMNQQAGAGCDYSCTTCKEGTCTAGCQIVCVADCKTSCTTYCEKGSVGTGGGCTVWTCEVACEHSCQETCQLSCQETCQLSCQETCQLSCQETCKSSCQSACEKGCQKACQINPCQSGCTGGCTSGCTGGCTSGCTGGCTSGCTGGCTANSCMTACAAVACQSGCTVCEASCQEECQQKCILGCIQACQVNIDSSQKAMLETGNWSQMLMDHKINAISIESNKIINGEFQDGKVRVESSIATLPPNTNVLIKLDDGSVVQAKSTSSLIMRVLTPVEVLLELPLDAEGKIRIIGGKLITAEGDYKRVTGITITKGSDATILFNGVAYSGKTSEDVLISMNQLGIRPKSIGITRITN